MSTPVVIFDVLGTLFPLTPVGSFVRSLLVRELTRLNASPTIIESLPSIPTLTSLLYAEAIKEAACLSYAQFYCPLGDLIPHLVQRLINRYLFQHTPLHQHVSLSAADKAALSSTLTSLPARPSASATLSTLAQYATLIALSNGSTASTTSLLSHASLLPFFSPTGILSADLVRATKPDANVYSLVTPHVKTDTPVFFVSQHSFDVHGVLRYNALREGNKEGEKPGSLGEEGRAWLTVWIAEDERSGWTWGKG